uniref:DUF2742 domain-containing protein n=1 Tax=Mycolicibacterium sp. TUM20985 TaxID=3023370 RepID=UPI003365A018
MSWWEVRTFVEAAIQQAGVTSWPAAGTPAWCALSGGDPRKWAALFDDAQHWALRVDTAQEAMAEASRDLSSAADWSAANRYVTTHNAFYAARPWLKRVTQ